MLVFWVCGICSFSKIGSALPCCCPVLCWLVPTSFAYPYTGCSQGQGLDLSSSLMTFASSAGSPHMSKSCHKGEGCLALQHGAAPCRLLHISCGVLQLCFEFSSWFDVSFSMGNVYGIGYQWKMFLLFELLYCCLVLKWLIAVTSTSVWLYPSGDWFNWNNWSLPWSVRDDLMCDGYKCMEWP